MNYTMEEVLEFRNNNIELLQSNYFDDKLILNDKLKRYFILKNIKSYPVRITFSLNVAFNLDNELKTLKELIKTPVLEEYEERREDGNKCCCSKENIVELIRIKYQGLSLIVGSSCIKKFSEKDEYINETIKILKSQYKEKLEMEQLKKELREEYHKQVGECNTCLYYIKKDKNKKARCSFHKQISKNLKEFKYRKCFCCEKFIDPTKKYNNCYECNKKRKCKCNVCGINYHKIKYDMCYDCKKNRPF